MIYDSKAVSEVAVAQCRFDLIARLEEQGWEEIDRRNGVIYLRRIYRGGLQ